MSKEVFGRLKYGETLRVTDIANEYPNDLFDVWEAVQNGHLNAQESLGLMTDNQDFRDTYISHPHPEERPQWEHIRDEKGNITGRRSLPPEGSQP